MLKLTNIVKSYSAGNSNVAALKGISIEFRKSEFVSVRLRKDHTAQYYRRP